MVSRPTSHSSQRCWWKSLYLVRQTVSKNTRELLRCAGIPLSGIRQHVTAEGRKPRGGFPLLSEQLDNV